MTSQQMRDKGYFDLFGDIYRFLQVSDASDWNVVVREADKICNRYQGTPLGSLSNSLMSSVINELERVNK